MNMVAEKLNDSDGGRKKYDIMNRGHDGFTIHGVKRILEKECILTTGCRKHSDRMQ